jgi:predicted Zn-dependent peptidase
MFEGSINVKQFDVELQKVGGSNNAFTNNDFTDYYISLPKENIETALWLESDRLLSLAFDSRKFATQKSVVIEEFKQTTLNEPYGDDMNLLRDLAYTTHPYKWATIGKDISHIQKATLKDMKNFFFDFYAPNNAILSIGGNFEKNYIYDIVNKWFGGIPKRNLRINPLPKEPIQTERKEMTVTRNVPFDVIYMGFHHDSRLDKEYYLTDLITDILDDGKSSRLFQRLVKEKQIFEDVDAFITGNNDCGLVILSGRPAKNISLLDAEKYFWDELEDLKTNKVEEREIQKTLNSIEFGMSYMNTKIMSKAKNLGFFELLGDANLINKEVEKYSTLNAQDIIETSNKIFTKENTSVLYYLAKK